MVETATVRFHGVASASFVRSPLVSRSAASDLKKTPIKRTVVFAAIITIVTIGAVLAQSASPNLVLITEQEAKLPELPVVSLIRRAGVTRGPKVILVSPADSYVKSPVHLQIRFESFGGAKVDLSSVKVTYVKIPPVDLSTRLASVTQASGINVPGAEIPAGIHHIRVDVKDSEGRSGLADFALKIAQ